jgi:hypothetical protein
LNVSIAISKKNPSLSRISISSVETATTHSLTYL